MIPESPIHRLDRIGGRLGLDLRVKRDDLLPFPGGGNKVRKVAAILETAERAGCDAVVTTGGVQSNHARVAALECARRGWPCRLVLHGPASALDRPTGNLLLMLLCDAKVEIVEPEGIAPAMEAAMHALREAGRRPYEVPGGGHCAAGAAAYAEAVRGLQGQCEPGGWRPDLILLASGTGTTQAGIVAGLTVIGWTTRVVGISVARRNPRGREAVVEAYREVCDLLRIAPSPEAIDFRDDWVGEGYEKASPAVHAAIRLAAAEGLILDPTYTGKAFAALLDLARGAIPAGSRVLFWHTGGLLNLMAAASGPTAKELLE